MVVPFWLPLSLCSLVPDTNHRLPELSTYHAPETDVESYGLLSHCLSLRLDSFPTHRPEK